MEENRKNSSLSETKIQKKVLTWLNRQPGIWATKGVPMFRRGVPDILACINGRFVALEVKRPGAKLTPIQKAQIELIQKAGGIAAVVTGIEDLARIIKDYEKAN